MSQLSLVIRLRPTRIALLTRPGDAAAIRKFMRACACLWGGVYNPIIPVFRTAPVQWRSGKYPERLKGYAVARGYADFFEPDVYVEAKKGLLEEAGLGALRSKHSLHERVLTLDELLRRQEHRDQAEPTVGLSVFDVLRHVYETEQRFQLREPRSAIRVKPSRSSPFVEAMFGAYPTDKATAYFGKGFDDVYRPERADASPETWRRIVKAAPMTPLSATRFGLENNRSWMHDLVVFVFNPDKAVDLIDLWNLRLEPKPILPVPLPWFGDLAGDVRELLIREHRPLRGNPHGVMHHGTIEFARSISEESARAALELLGDMPKDAKVAKFWRTPIWERHESDRVHRDTRLEVTAKERRVSADIEEGERPTAKFEALAPDFAARYGAAHSMRWVNSVRVSHYGREDVATILPFNTRDWSWPRLDFSGDPIQVGAEGWIFGQRYKDASESIELHRQEDIIIGALKRSGIEAKLSEPGHIAKQVLAHLGGFWGVSIIADKPTLVVMNEMAGGVRRREVDGVETEEVFDRRSKPLSEWQRLISQREHGRGLRHKFKLEDFTSRNIVRLGLETECPHCKVANWHSLTTADYELTCERCLKKYQFPQADLRGGNRNWSYRTIGPFAIHDFARGAYGALLALNVLHRFGGTHSGTTSSTALELHFDGIRAEADYVAFYARERFDRDLAPQLVIGEAKSLGEGELIKAKDLAKLRAIGAKLPGSTIMISVMRDDFTATEKTLLTRFVKWARRQDNEGRPTNAVVLLTGNELFYDFSISHTWKKLGGKHEKYADYDHANKLDAFAEATQAIYLGLPTFYEERRAARKKRQERKKAKAGKL